MVRIKTILCPTDFSEFSERALVYAMDLAARCKAKLYVQHVIEGVLLVGPDNYAVPADLLRKTVVEQREYVTERLIGRLAQEKDLDYATIILRGNPHEEIVKAAKAHAIDLIVMGTHGRSGLGRLVLGSVTEQVLKHAPGPVLVVYHAAEDLRRPLDFRTILAPVDFSEYALKALEYALDLTQEYRSALWVLHVVEHVPEAELAGLFDSAQYPKEQYVSAVRERLVQMIPQDLRENYRINELVKIGSPPDVITDTARNIDADLVVMGIVGQGALKSALFGSTAYQVIKEVPCPVLTVRGPRNDE